MSTTSENNKRIAKNTLFMYLRMLIQMAVAFYTVRVIFNVLGTDNYGIYNVVAGIIVFFTFINNGLTTATKRYVTSEIAQGTIESGRHVFNTCVIAHILISLIVLVFAETIGVWLVNHILNIPPDRMMAANWVFQMSILAAVLGIMQSPFDAAIVAHERMNIYAYLSILDVVLKLTIVFILKTLPGDKLIVYSCLLCITFIIMMLVNCLYCHRIFPICKWKYKKDWNLLRNIFKFMSWSLLGQLAVVGTNQGIGMLVNIYFNVVVNAAMGISNQIINNVNKFVSNFQVAFNPQIIKSYTNKDYDYLLTLIMRSSKISSFLIIIFLVPLFFETNNILSIWLGNYPPYSIEFCQLTLIAIYLEAIGAPLWMLQYSQSNIKKYQIITSVIYGSIFPLSWLLLLIPNIPPYCVIFLRIITFMILLCIRLWFAYQLLPILNIKFWLSEILGKGICIIIIACFITGSIAYTLSINKLFHVIIITGISLCCTLSLTYLIGLNKKERIYCLNIIRNKLYKKQV